MYAQTLLPKLTTYCNGLPGEFDMIAEKRKELLADLGEFIVQTIQTDTPVRLTVICTANSRRSHMGQLWLQTAAAFYGIRKVETSSGGTNASAFNPRAVAALIRAGFEIQILGSSDNPQYKARYGEGYAPVIMFSMKYDDETNPHSGFAAIMVCSEADAACPVVPGAEARFSLPFEDPKDADGTADESLVYDERCRQIAREMFYVMANVSKRLPGSG